MPVRVQLSFLPKTKLNSTTVGPRREVALTSAVGGSSMIGNVDVGEMGKGWDGLRLSSFVLDGEVGLVTTLEGSKKG